MADIYEQASELKNAIKSVVREVVREEFGDCFRVKKALVTTAPDGSVCGVQIVGDATELMLPYSSACASVTVGDVVWVGLLGLSMRNAIVWQNATLSAGGGSSYTYTETPNGAGGTTIEIVG